jgi:drug/metabolite transporter (DMT)-like permease
MNRYLFKDVTPEKWITIILIIWGAAVIWAIGTSLIKRIKSKDREPSGLCILGCVISGIVGGVCTLNLVGNALKIDVGFITVMVLFFGGGIIGGSSFFIGSSITSKK